LALTLCCFFPSNLSSILHSQKLVVTITFFKHYRTSHKLQRLSWSRAQLRADSTASRGLLLVAVAGTCPHGHTPTSHRRQALAADTSHRRRAQSGLVIGELIWSIRKRKARDASVIQRPLWWRRLWR
jgi:hypothetical protein